MIRKIKTYKSEDSGLNWEQEEFLYEFTKGKWSYDSSTGLVDVEGDFDCTGHTLNNVKFGNVSGDFWCNNGRLTNLKGAPQKVGGYFSCAFNQLTTLEGAPQEVGWTFLCDGNDLISLEGAPEKMGGWFHCDAFKLKVGGWNTDGWLKVLNEGTPEAQSLVLTIISVDALNLEIKKDPGGMIRVLKSVWWVSQFQKIKKQLKFPKEYGDINTLVNSLNRVDSVMDFI